MLSPLTSAVSGEVQQQDVGAKVGQVVEGLQMLLQLPVGQFGLQDRCQVTEHVGVQRRGPATGSTLYSTALFHYMLQPLLLHLMVLFHSQRSRSAESKETGLSLDY